jgi:hypothetical protein
MTAALSFCSPEAGVFNETVGIALHPRGIWSQEGVAAT